MCPGIAVAGGGGDGGGGSGSGSKKGKGKKGAGKKKGKKNASGKKKKGGKGKGDPVCPVTGRVFTDVLDFALPGVMPFVWVRSYSSRSTRDGDLGIGWSHAFSWVVDVAGRKLTVIDDAGLEQIFDRPASAEPVTNELGWSLRREGEGFRLFLGENLTYWFGPPAGKRHFLIAVSDVHGNRISFDRDQNGTLRGIIDSAGRSLRVDSDNSGRIVSIAVATSAAATSFIELVRYRYDPEGHLVSVTDAEDFVFRYVYAGHLLVEHQLPTGLSYFYRYDGASSEARCIESWGNYRDGIDPALEVQLPQPSPNEGEPPIRGINYVRFTWLPDENYSEMVDGRGGVTRHFGDDSGRVIKEVDPAGGVTEVEFDPETGEVARETMPDGVVREAKVDSDGVVRSVSSNDGERIREFMHEGMEWSFDELRSSLTRRLYDPNGDVRVVQHSDGTTETYELDARGLATSSTNRRGAHTQFAYDAMGNLVERRGPHGVAQFEYDYLGRCLARVDVTGRTEWTWDNRFEITGVHFPDGRMMSVERDGLRDITRIVEGRREWRFEYGGIHWLTKITTNAGRVVEIKYDGEGDIVLVRNARGQTLRQTWDRAGRCIACETYEGVTLHASYDVAGMPIQVDGLRAREQRVYDTFGEIHSAETDDETVTVEHDPTARTVTTDNGKIKTETIFDGMRQPIRDTQGDYETQITWVGGGTNKVVSNVGTALEHLRGANGKTETLVVGGMGRLRIDEPAGTGWVSRLGDQLALRREYDVSGHLVWQALTRIGPSVTALDNVGVRGDPQLVAWRAYVWEDGFLRAEHRSDGTVVEYVLDGDCQVTARRIWRGNNVEHEEAWGYDAGGSPVRPGATYDTSFRPIKLGNEDLEYDAAGFLVARQTDAGEIRYEWSAAGELVRVVAPDRVVELTYDARGRRARKQVFRDDRLIKDLRWVWADNVVLHEVDALTGATRTFLREDDRWNPFAHVDREGDAQRIFFHVNDPIGAVDFVVDSRGTTVWEAERGLFGDDRPTTERVKIDVRLPNQHWDDDVGLSYNFYRWFDPRFGLFVSPDPALLGGSLNPRDIVFNPTVSADPLGLAPLPANFGQPGTPTSNLVPGPFAAPSTGTVPGFVPANDTAWATPSNPTGNFNTTQKGFPVAMRRAVDAAGKQHGCHGCGTKTPGNGSKHFVPDHQPPVSQQKAWARENGSPFPGPVHIYPHCQNCSLKQRNQQSVFRHDEEANAAAAAAAGVANAANPSQTVNMANVNANAAALGVTNGF
ncbi:MAG: DUF6531 domain-containing protein [Polyangiales bacterium]